MESPTPHASVARVTGALAELGLPAKTKKLDDSARSAREAADALGVEVGQIASSIVFTLTTDDHVQPLLVVTSGRHRVDTELLADHVDPGVIGRADADFVRSWSGFAIGGVSPIGWIHDSELFQPLTFVDLALSEHDKVWAAAGHTHVVYQTTFADLVSCTNGIAITVARD